MSRRATRGSRTLVLRQPELLQKILDLDSKLHVQFLTQVKPVLLTPLKRRGKREGGKRKGTMYSL